ncbi:hypothetical protein DT603_00720 [Pseudoxanthomonas gei]|uniref:Uncharacterized protein n=1 Tax=Pseudoxanthomonas gei TaxID=1383030 RepID=A0ABX0A8X7_9GAMM|nr:hypothetical protein [Pseudoxanthomonas gei]
MLEVLRMQRLKSVWGISALWLLAGACLQVQAVEISDMKDFSDLHGRYAPAGDCKRQPRIVIDAGGMTFEVATARTRVTNPEFAASFFGGASDSYEGISRVFFPFRNKQADGYPIIMMFNADEKKGILTVAGQDEGWKGGPPLTPLNKALVAGSPYSRCR